MFSPPRPGSPGARSSRAPPSCLPIPPMRLAVLLLLLAGAPTSAKTTVSRVEREVEKFIGRALKVTKGAGGETAVGAGIGFAAGFTCKQVQATAVSVCLAAGAAGVGAYCLGYLNDKQVEKIKSTVQSKADAAAALLPRILQKLDIDRDGSLTTLDGKLALSRVTPFAKRHVGFTGGLVGGLLVGYSL